MSEDERVCKDCQFSLPMKAFSSFISRERAYHRHTCIKCTNIQQRYKISGRDFHNMLASQMYRCLICEEPIDELTARIDHCHNDQAVRSLLCNGCNVGIAMMKHDKEITLRAIEYLTKFT